MSWDDTRLPPANRKCRLTHPGASSIWIEDGRRSSPDHAVERHIRFSAERSPPVAGIGGYTGAAPIFTVAAPDSPATAGQYREPDGSAVWRSGSCPGPAEAHVGGRVTLAAMEESWTRALAVVAHPDDLEYGMASAIARWTQQGKAITYLLVTRGEAGIAGMSPETCAPVREAEQRQSAAVVGVHDVEFLAHADGAVEYGLQLRRDIASGIRRARPEVVLTMNFELTWPEGGVNHADHRAVGLAVLDACRDAANEWVFPDAGPAWEGVRGAFVSGTSTPTHFVDVTETIERGIASLQEHRAYIDGLGTGFDPDEFLRKIAGFGGMAAGCDMAVLFQSFQV